MTTAVLPQSVSCLSPRLLLASAAAGKTSLVRFSVDQYQKMIEAGIVPEDNTIELLYGILVRKDRSVLGEDPLGHSPPHRQAIVKLTRLASRIENELRRLQVQLPVVIGVEHEPEPDASVVLGRYEDFDARLPTALEVPCVIEVAHSSLERDEEDKLPAYASAGIPQYLIINLRISAVEVYGDPDPASGRYRTKVTLSPPRTVRLHLGGGEFLEVPAADLLP